MNPLAWFGVALGAIATALAIGLTVAATMGLPQWAAAGIWIAPLLGLFAVFISVGSLLDGRRRRPVLATIAIILGALPVAFLIWTFIAMYTVPWL